VKQQTGFSIGGIPPVGHTHSLTTVLDQDLQNFSEIWAAAGTPNAVFKLTPQQLQELTQGSYAPISA
ncbi:MAG: YbaK/EbsC family protein, partial [Gammaproteobacteria bacterium]|nr:YbaK/EbsC family protein [Gammaproteobacteria bacterium]